MRIVALISALLLAAATIAGDDPWRDAIDRSDMQTLRTLAAAPHINLQAKRGKTALMVATAKNDLELMKRLIDLGADVNKFNHAGGTALMYAAQYGYVDAARLLIAHGANVMALGAKFGTALMIAVLKRHLDMVDLLLQNGADVNAPDVLGGTPLLRAVERDYVDVADRLITDRSVDVNATDRSGMTALHMAAVTGNEQLADVLLAHGARKDMKNGNGETPADVAQRGGHAGLAAKLR